MRAACRAGTLLCGLQVPADVAPRDLAVTFEPFGLRVGHRRSGEAFLEGRLERGIVPAECVWMQGGGAGEDGCLLWLRKMNLELLRRCGSPACPGAPCRYHMLNPSSCFKSR